MLRLMNKKLHLSGVMEIENTNSHMSSPVSGMWTEKDFISVLGQKNYLGMVAVDNNFIAGFAIYSLMSDKIHICNMAVHPSKARMGIGKLLINQLKSKRRILEIDVRETNICGCTFLKNVGFNAIGVVRNWYETPKYEDAYKFHFKGIANVKNFHRSELPDGSVRISSSRVG